MKMGRVSEIKKKIEEAAEVIFSQKGYFQATIDDITRLAGVAKGSFYTYFKHKQDLLFNLLDNLHNSLLTIIKNELSKVQIPCPYKEFKDQFINFLKASLNIFMEKRKISELFFLELASTNPEFKERYIRYKNEVIKVITSLLSRFNPKIDSTLLSQVIEAIREYFIRLHILNKQLIELDQIAELIFQLVLPFLDLKSIVKEEGEENVRTQES